MAAEAPACTCQPKGGLPHGEHPYDYGYDDPADCPVHGRNESTGASRPRCETTDTGVGREGDRFVVYVDGVRRGTFDSKRDAESWLRNIRQGSKRDV